MILTDIIKDTIKISTVTGVITGQAIINLFFPNTAYPKTISNINPEVIESTKHLDAEDKIECPQQLIEQIKKLGQENKDLRAKFEEARETYESTIKKQEEKIEDYLTKLEATLKCLDKIDTTEVKPDSLTNVIDSLKVELKSSKNKYRSLKADYSSLDTLYNNTLNEISSLNREILRLELTNSVNVEIKGILAERLDKAIQDKKELEDNITRYYEDLLKYHENISRYLDQIKKKKRNFLVGLNYDKYGEEYIPKIVFGIEYVDDNNKLIKGIGIGLMAGGNKFSKGPIAKERIEGPIDDPYHQRIVNTTSSSGNMYVLDPFLIITWENGIKTELMLEYGEDHGSETIVTDSYQGTPRGERDPIRVKNSNPTKSKNLGFKFGVTKKIGKHFGIHANVGYVKKNYSVGAGVRVFR